MVVSIGIEPISSPSQGGALSIELTDYYFDYFMVGAIGLQPILFLVRSEDDFAIAEAPTNH